MFERILVPLDGSPEAEEALNPLLRVLRRKDAEVILFRSVLLPPLVNMDAAGAVMIGQESEALTYLEQMCARLADAGLNIRTQVGQGPAADAILKAAGELDVTLISMSTHGRSGFARLMLGSVTEEVLRRSPIPVHVTNVRPPGIRLIADSFRTILVPFDGTRESLCVEPLVVETARLFGAGVAILRVEDGAPHGPDFGFVGHLMDGPVNLDEHPEILDRDMVEAGNRFACQGLRTTLFRVRGDSVEKINHLARILPAGLIVMASHGRRGVSRIVSGSVAEEVVRRAEVPVLVARIEAAAAAPLKERRVS